jgi:hypothetical protein
VEKWTRNLLAFG